MRPVQVITGATGPSGWVEIDYLQKAFAVGFLCTVGGATAPSMIYKIQAGFYSGNYDTELTLTRSTTTATLTFKAAYTDPNTQAAWVNHGLSTTDSIVVNGAGAPFDGTFQVASVTDSRVITYTVLNSGATTAAPGFRVARMFVSDHPIVTGATGSTAGNYAYPINYVRTNITTFGSGSLTLSLNQGV